MTKIFSSRETALFNVSMRSDVIWARKGMTEQAVECRVISSFNKYSNFHNRVNSDYIPAQSSSSNVHIHRIFFLKHIHSGSLTPETHSLSFTLFEEPTVLLLAIKRRLKKIRHKSGVFLHTILKINYLIDRVLITQIDSVIDGG